jgi:uncharacterized protein (DUF433 family)
MQTIGSGHIVLDENGIARIEGSRMKVIHLVMEKMANGWSPEELQRQFPHLTLAKIYAAFAYYYDHQAELDAEIQRDQAEAERMRTVAGESPIAQRLRAEGKLR